jgi:hypothetical protein
MAGIDVHPCNTIVVISHSGGPYDNEAVPSPVESPLGACDSRIAVIRSFSFPLALPQAKPLNYLHPVMVESLSCKKKTGDYPE